MSESPSTLSKPLLRYANCWEDAEVLIGGLQPEPGSRILSIGSAGDNSFSLLATGPERVVAIDTNPVQLHLIALKKAAIATLTYREVLAFLGFAPSSQRAEMFRELKGQLEPEAARYWEAHIRQIGDGIIHQGKFERYFSLFSHKLLPWIHSRKNVEALLRKKSASEQKDFYDARWNIWRWRLLFKLFFSSAVMGKYGRDPEFLRHVQGSVSDLIFHKAERQLQSAQAQENFMLRYSLTGSFGDLLPHYLQPDRFERIKANLHALQIRSGYAQEAIDQKGAFTHMNLSNIFEYMDPETFARTAAQLAGGLAPNGRMAYWNLMVPRSVSDACPGDMAYQKELSETLTARDRGFFYARFVTEEKK